MSERLAALMAHPHWPYVWPCYALLLVMIAALVWRAVTRLAHWKRRADAEAATP